MNIDIEKRYTINELNDYQYDYQIKQYKKRSFDYHHNNLELGIPMYDENYNYCNGKNKKKVINIFAISIFYILGLCSYMYQVFNYHHNINYIIKQSFGVFYGYFLVIYPVIFSFSIILMVITTKKIKLLHIYDIATISIIVSSLIIIPNKNFYGKYLLISLITLVGSLPIIITYICIPILKIMYWLII
jgi:hypothetical protein